MSESEQHESAKHGRSEDGSAQPGSAQPGSAQPGSAQPGSAQPGSAQPGSAQLGSSQPDRPHKDGDAADPKSGDSDDRADELWAKPQEYGWDFARRVYLNVTNNNFNADVEADGATFGNAGAAGGRRSTRRATGVLADGEVTTALRGFLPPPAFEPALVTLLDRHIALLVGDRGCGRRTGALALLRRATDGPITSVSPAYTFTDLAGKFRFQGGRGYVVQDHIGDREAFAVREFECARLADKLRKAGAYLVVTATPMVIANRTLRQYTHRWQCPDLLELFDALIRDVHIDADVLETARAMAGQQRTPHEVVDLVQRLAADPANAIDELGSSAKTQVSEWFDTKPGKREVLAVAALAFLHRLPERVFEAHLAQLRTLAGDKSEKSDELPQRRSQTARDHLLVTGERATVVATHGLVSERIVAFHSEQHRAHVVAELCDRYGYELWEPLRKWLDEIAASEDLAAIVELALGMALLARTSFGEVVDSLDRWADGDFSEQVTAAITLWGMSAENGLAPLALQTALRWIRDVDDQPRPAVAAAMALGGDLGLLYQSDALRWLWYLVRRAEPVGMVAQFALAWLFTAGVDDASRCTAILRQAGHEFREATARPNNQVGVRAVRMTVVSLLSAQRPDTGEPAAVTVIREHPASVEALGALWAKVLCSAPHRKDAFNALVDCLAAMANDQWPDSHDQVRRLGAAVLAEMSAPHRELLQRDLTYAANNERARRRPPNELVSALLTTLDGST